MGISLFWQRVGVVLTGSALAQFAPLIVLPILTRSLAPSALADYFTWLAMATILSVAGTLRLEVAILQARTNHESTRLLLASLISALSLPLLVCSLFGIAVPRQYLTGIFLGDLSQIILVSAMATALATTQACNQMYARHAMFGRQAAVRVALAVLTAGAHLSAIALGAGVRGLVTAQLATQVLAASWMVFDAHRMPPGRNPHGPRLPLRAVLKAHWRFPVFSLPADIINAVSAQLPLLISGTRFSAEAVGGLGLTNRVMGAPITLLAGSILTVFREEASREFLATGSCIGAYRKTCRSLLCLSLPPFLMFALFSEELFEFVFGSGWRQAGSIASILAPMLFLKFVASPLSYTLYLMNRNLHDLIWQVALLVVTLASFFYSRDFMSSLKFYSTGYSALYILYLFMSHSAAKGRDL
jgi:O-antigen/teichoic acid export membrane protein